MAGCAVPGSRSRAGDTPFVLVAVSEQGLVEQLVIDTPTPRIPLLKLPAKAGNSWVYDPGHPGHCKTEYTIAAEAERVEVPAGRFTAVRVRTNQTLGGKSVKSACWYAPRVGLVKVAREDGAEVFEYVLKSFTPGK